MRLLLVLAVLIIGFGALTLWRAARNEAQTLAAYPPLGQILTVNGHKVHALVQGSGPDLVLIHGSSGNLRDFTHSLVGKLSGTYRVIAFDRPGLGYSDPVNRSGDTIFEQAKQLRDAAIALGANKPIVVGQSYGGAVALAWATEFPDDIAALVTLAAPALPWDSPLPTLYQVNSHPVIGRISIPLVSAWVTEAKINREVASVFLPQQPPEGYAAHFGTGLTLMRSALRENALQRANLIHEIREMEPRLPSISVPLEILHGDIDTTVSFNIHAEPLSQLVEKAALTPLPGIGHMPQHVAQEDVIAAIHRASARAGLH